MQNAWPDAIHGDVRLTIDISDLSNPPTLADRLRALTASLAMPLVEGDATAFPHVSLIIVDTTSGFSPQARQAVAIARTSGVRHVVLAIAAHAPDDQAAVDAIVAAFADFTAKLEFATALAVPFSAAVHGTEGLAWDNSARLRSHLAALAAAASQSQPAIGAAPLSEQFAAHIACISQQDLLPGREYRLRLRGHETTASVTAVKYRLDIDSLRRVPARTLTRGEIGVCTIATDEPLALSETSEDGDAARFTLSDLFSGDVIAAGSVDFALRRGMNVHWQPFTVTKELRAATKDQHPCIVWFTGLSGSGKSTIANLVEGWLALHGRHTYLLDGDNVRHGLNKDLGFTAADRVENIRRVGEVARLFVDAGTIVLCSFISPFRAEREAVRSLVEPGEFIEIHVTAPLAVCERRDPKGLYAKSRAGHLPNFTGIDSPYEVPDQPDLVLDTTTAPATELAQRVVELLQDRGVVSAPDTHLRAVTHF